MSLLVNNPSVLKKAHNEIDSHVGHDRCVEESDMLNLPYLACIIKETLRMYPAGPLLPHESSKDCMVSGYHVPRGTMLLVNAWGIQNDPHIWGDPETFRPERFEGVEVYGDGFKLLPFDLEGEVVREKTWQCEWLDWHWGLLSSASNGEEQVRPRLT